MLKYVNASFLIQEIKHQNIDKNRIDDKNDNVINLSFYQ